MCFGVHCHIGRPSATTSPRKPLARLCLSIVMHTLTKTGSRNNRRNFLTKSWKRRVPRLQCTLLWVAFLILCYGANSDRDKGVSPLAWAFPVRIEGIAGRALKPKCQKTFGCHDWTSQMVQRGHRSDDPSWSERPGSVCPHLSSWQTSDVENSREQSRSCDNTQMAGSHLRFCWRKNLRTEIPAHHCGA